MRKNVILPYKLIDHPLNASFNSTPFNVQYLDNIAIQMAITTTANTGLFTVEASIDGVIYDTLKLSPAISALTGVNQVISVNLNQVPYVWIRVVFKLGTGTNGNCVAFISAKEL